MPIAPHSVTLKTSAAVIVRVPSFTRPDVRYPTRAYVVPGTYPVIASIRDAKDNLWLQSTSGTWIVAESNGHVYARITPAKQVTPAPSGAKRAAYLTETDSLRKKGASERASLMNPWHYLPEQAQEWETQQEKNSAEFMRKAAIPGSSEFYQLNAGAFSMLGADDSPKSNPGNNGVLLTFISVGILVLGTRGSLLRSTRA